jgi:ribosomal protein S13
MIKIEIALTGIQGVGIPVGYRQTCESCRRRRICKPYWAVTKWRGRPSTLSIGDLCEECAKKIEKEITNEN